MMYSAMVLIEMVSLTQEDVEVILLLIVDVLGVVEHLHEVVVEEVHVFDVDCLLVVVLLPPLDVCPDLLVVVVDQEESIVPCRMLM